MLSVKEHLSAIKLSSFAISIVILVCFLIDFSFKNWEKQNRVIEHDVHSYYAYLPAKFIYDDIKIEKSTYRLADNYYMFWPSYTDKGAAVIKTTMGVAIMYSPFFFVAHIYASLTHYPENGFSEPYKIFLMLSSIFFLLVGLGFLRKTLQHFSFSDYHVAITILLVGLGTNLLCYSSQSATMSHSYSFCLISVFVYYSIKWHENHAISTTIVLGILLGLITLIRPTNIIIVVFFALYNVSSLKDFSHRLSLFRKECFLINLIILFAFLVWIPQLLYWKTVTGNYFYYSFSDERFFFDRPRIIEGLFSFRKGWLVYTPMMAFSIIGLFIPAPDQKKIRSGIFLFLAINIYIIFSWWCWWYGGSFGQRSMIDCYALLSLPIAFLVRYITMQKRMLNILFYLVAAFLIWLNIFQTFQYEKLTLHWEGMTKELYFKQFGRLEKVPEYEDLVSYPDFEQAKKGNSFDATPSSYKKAAELKNSFFITAFDNMYVCAESDSLLYANKSVGSTWETFVFENHEKDLVSLRAHTGMFVSAEITHNKEITAKRKEAGGWEKFVVVRLEKDVVAFKAFNGKFLTIDDNNRQLFAISDSIGIKERFRIIPQ
ncbi:MAG TPA: hypothetical protein VF868_02960 [Bacteroidia bacterium]|jgi:hypothetical protein